MSQAEMVLEHAAATVGMTLSDLKKADVSDIRRKIEEKHGKPLSFTSEFPVIGRGNVLRDRIMTSDQINSEIDEILK